MRENGAGNVRLEINMFSRRLIIAVAVVIAATAAHAEFYSFYKLTNNTSYDLGSQFQMEVTDPGNHQVAFTFRNFVGTESSICDVYFDDDNPHHEQDVLPCSWEAQLFGLPDKLRVELIVDS